MIWNDLFFCYFYVVLYTHRLFPLYNSYSGLSRFPSHLQFPPHKINQWTNSRYYLYFDFLKMARRKYHKSLSLIDAKQAQSIGTRYFFHGYGINLTKNSLSSIESSSCSWSLLLALVLRAIKQSTGVHIKYSLGMYWIIWIEQIMCSKQIQRYE